MHISCAMMASDVTPPIEDKGAEVDGAVEAGGVVVSIQGCLGLRCALLRRTVAASKRDNKNRARRSVIEL